ncbi:head GIN domain-containing protein [Rasiella sp. SM2506]|uniref:head GIN domain-containing protein n=1 Tax=Rasiella sp. SM2506 TaxID=3423914 RepID=UPI003D79EF63
MKGIFTVLFFASISMIAQESIEKNVGDFSELKVYDLIYVNLIPAEENKVVLTGEDAQDISLINKDGVLKIRMETSKLFSGSDNAVVVYYKNLIIIDANEGTQIRSDQTIKRDVLKLRVQEGGEIKLTVDVNELVSKAVTGGKLQLKGTAKLHDLNINTGGISSGKELTTETTKVKIKAGGEANISASELAEINIKAGGDVFVYGNPKVIDQKKLFGGRVKVIKEAP